MKAETLLSEAFRYLFKEPASPEIRVVAILLLAVLAHVLVRVVGAISERFLRAAQARERLRFVAQQPKFVTVVRLAANTLTWTIYFLAIGLFLEEVGVNLTTYLASASVVGLAISFGSQGLVQDMVIGLTLIFSDAMDVDDMVEIVGSAVVVGRIQEIGLRFIKIVNLYNQVVFIPNRTVANVSRFPHGGIYAYADVQVPEGVDAGRVTQIVRTASTALQRQFSAVVLAEPVLYPVAQAAEGAWSFLRVRFTIWPGQTAVVETTFRQQVLRALKMVDPSYADWQITILYRALET